MKLDQVQLTNFRNVSQARLNPSKSLSVITGVNGSGKSSILESIYYLGFGRSFRTQKYQSAINHNSDAFSVFAKGTKEDGGQVSVGIERSRSDQFLCSINGTHSNRLADLVSLIPVQLFTPQSTDLVIGSPSERRRFIDWGVFHVEHSFQTLFVQFNKLLKQRNALLKQGASLRAAHNHFWEQQYILAGNRLCEYRNAYTEALTPIFNRISSEFLPEFSVEISYYRGWEKGLTLGEVLEKKYEYDAKVGHTSVGPHKADLKFRIDGVNAQEILSRGQLRMAVAALQLAQTELFTLQTSRKGIFLLDDVGAELDLEKRERFIDGLLLMDTQVFVTAIEKQQLSFINKYNDRRMFHVEHGHVTEE
ncbi:DNA replication/repair protein RecF [Alteromonas aestuariivivens]|uniref:DNA replication and repair protein RecF n=1 Tax=Alteromonas aestuariivivens TaxID=1938339 RepID=A0A3D8M596_9ALTE|nr:DNA replication/repair protein RecF [Alteromonas aestuariivivens]RDV24778.1 DNA replication/repair protein RecF [Alteromonas aestuariivivens]